MTDRQTLIDNAPKILEWLKDESEYPEYRYDTVIKTIRILLEEREELKKSAEQERDAATPSIDQPDELTAIRARVDARVKKLSPSQGQVAFLPFGKSDVLDAHADSRRLLELLAERDGMLAELDRSYGWTLKRNTKIELELAEARENALEEGAKYLEGRRDSFLHNDSNRKSVMAAEANEADKCARAIRSLKTTQQSDDTTHGNYAGRIEDKPLSKKDRNAYLREHFDIPTLRKVGFFTTERTFDEMEQRILMFFGIKDIREFSQLDESIGGHMSLGGDKSLRVHYGQLVRPTQ